MRLATSILLLAACSSSAAPDRRCTTDEDCPTGICVVGTCRAIVADGSVYCLDRDHDGYGAGCALGADCDDREPTQNAIEICDERDNDCDDRADEDVPRTECGDCDPSCAVVRTGADGEVPREPFALSSTSRDVLADADGSLVLASGAPAELNVAWIATYDGTVAKIDTREPRLVARYYTAPPERTLPRGVAVGARGDAFVASLEGSVVRIAAHREDCVDRDGDGIETGGPAPLPFEDEECRRWLGHVEGQPGAVAVRLVPGPDGALEERLFVGSDGAGGSHTITIFELDADTGVEVSRMQVESLPESDAGGLTAHDLIVDARAQLWIVTNYGTVFGAPGATLARVDTERCPGSPECAVGCAGADGDACAVQRFFLPGLGTNCATLDARQRLWLSDFDDALIYAYDAAQPFGARIRMLTPRPLGVPIHGIAADADRRLWAAQDGRLVAYDLATLAPDPIATIGTEGLAIASSFVDDLGRGWGLSMHGAATIAAVEGTTASVITNALSELAPVTAWCSDPTGAEVRSERGPHGTHIARIDACEAGQARGPVRWRWLAIDADVSTDAFLGLRARTGTEDTIDAAPWIMVPTSARLDLESLFGRLRITPGEILEVELVLRTAGPSRPRVRFLDVARSASCTPFG